MRWGCLELEDWLVLVCGKISRYCRNTFEIFLNYLLSSWNDISTMTTKSRKLSLGASPTWDDLPFIWLWGWQHYVKVMSYLISYRSQTNRRIALLLNIYRIKCTVPIVECNFYKTFNQFWTGLDKWCPTFIWLELVQ